MQILLTTKDTREGSGTPPANDMLQTSFRRPHTNSPVKDEIHGARGRPHLIVTRKKKPESEANVCGGG